MRILHYALGFPPYRRGGLTQYCIDLMTAQCRQGNEVAMCWSGEVGVLFPRKLSVKRHSPYCVKGAEIGNFEITGIYPVPLLEGVSCPEQFMRPVKTDAWVQFLRQWKPDVLHFHTLMGLPADFVKAARQQNIRCVFTAHDYYGICPRTTLLRSDGRLCDGQDGRLCAACNAAAPGGRKLAVLQSGLYRRMKDTAAVKRLRKRHWQQENSPRAEKMPPALPEREALYQQLRNYYTALLNQFDLIHYNSTITRNMYQSVGHLTGESRVLPITHGGIRDQKVIKQQKSGILTFSYLGPDTYNKGYFMLKEAMKQLYREGAQFRLNVYFQDDSEPFLVPHQPYRYEELPAVMDEADCVVQPSVWYETFGFVVLEALSFGVPVVISQRVGAKDLVEDGKSGMIVEADQNALKSCIAGILDHPGVLQEMNRYIAAHVPVQTMADHEKEIRKLYEA